MEDRKVKIAKDRIAHTSNIEHSNRPIRGKILSLGNFTITYSVIQIIILPLYMIFAKDNIWGGVLVGIFFIPMLIEGIRIRNIGDTNIGKIKKIIIFLIIYSILIILLSMIGGGRPTILLVFLLFQLFKTKKEINSVNTQTLKDIITKKIDSEENVDKQRKVKVRKLSIKSWIIISILFLVSFIIIYIVKQKPSFLFHNKPKTFFEEFVMNYKSHIPNDWNIINIEDLGLIAIPKTLEVRKEESKIAVINKSFNETFYKISGLKDHSSDGNITIQQAGLNEQGEESFSTYARVIINIYNVEDGAVPRKDDKLNLSIKDLNALKDSNFSEQEKFMKYLNCNIEAKTIDEVYINKMNAIKFTYLRTCGNNPQVYVEQYKFLNYNQIVEIILSYRTNNSDMWEKDFSRIIGTFILTN